MHLLLPAYHQYIQMNLNLIEDWGIIKWNIVTNKELGSLSIRMGCYIKASTTSASCLPPYMYVSTQYIFTPWLLITYSSIVASQDGTHQYSPYSVHTYIHIHFFYTFVEWLSSIITNTQPPFLMTLKFQLSLEASLFILLLRNLIIFLPTSILILQISVWGKILKLQQNMR